MFLYVLFRVYFVFYFACIPFPSTLKLAGVCWNIELDVDACHISSHCCTYIVYYYCLDFIVVVLYINLPCIVVSPYAIVHGSHTARTSAIEFPFPFPRRRSVQHYLSPLLLIVE
jgi:hypothetical protein